MTLFSWIVAAALWMFGRTEFLRAEVLLPSATTRLSLSFAFILCGAAGGVKEGARVIFIPGLSLMVWIPRSINSLKVVNRENAT